MRRKRNRGAILCAVALLLLSATACNKDFEQECLQSEPEPAVTMEVAKETGVSLGRKFENPYSIKNMREVCAELRKTRALDEEIDVKVTDLYVRFLPKDGDEYSLLKDSLNLLLFNYPLDCEIIGTGSIDYHDPTIPADQMTWQYTTVKADFKFPENVKYEILEECCIPDVDGEAELTRSGDTNIARQMEYLALEKVGYIKYMEQKTGEKQTRGWFNWGTKPQGQLKVYDSQFQRLVPLKGVRITARTLIIPYTSYTDENGFYKFDTAFLINPHYAVHFETSKDYEIWGNWGMFTGVASYSVGCHSNRGVSMGFYENSDYWGIAVTHNSAYEYYYNCRKYPDLYPDAPPTSLKIWAKSSSGTGGAPMLRKTNGIIGFTPNSSLLRYLALGAANFFVTSVYYSFKSFLPDIMISLGDKDSYDIHEIVSHELSHASHFSKVGSGYWTKYISFIITNGWDPQYLYGKRSDFNSGICEVGELWGYAMGYIERNEKYGKDIKQGLFNVASDYNCYNLWFRPHIIWDLYASKTLTKREIYNCMGKKVVNLQDLKNEMIYKYPSKNTDITKIFARYGF